MKKVNSLLFLENLKEQTRDLILKAEQLKHFSIETLANNPQHDQWSVAQVLEHLNIYCRYYLTTIEKKLHHSEENPALYFTSGWLGNYFTRMMRPENNKVKNKMKAPVNGKPSSSPAVTLTLLEFIQHQHQILNLLQVASSHNLNKNRIPISISRFISLKLGDTFNFLIAHQQRHFVQIANTLEIINKMERTGQVTAL